jgi:hypothetical protein
MSTHPEYAEYRQRVPMLLPALRRQITTEEPVRSAGV